MNVDVLEEVDIEEYAKRGEKPPQAQRYRIKIDGVAHVVTVPAMTGKELLALAGKNPPEQYQIFQKVRGGQLEEIKLNEKVDFTRPGVEKFITLPLDQTEG